MRTEYVFNVDTAELVYYRRAEGLNVRTVNLVAYDVQELCSMFVDEGALAERQFFNHFGDDSSWPEGWYSKLLAPTVTERRMGGSTWRPAS